MIYIIFPSQQKHTHTHTHIKLKSVIKQFLSFYFFLETPQEKDIHKLEHYPLSFHLFRH